MQNQTKDPKIIDLIHEVRIHPELYDYRLTGHYDVSLKDKFWKEIAFNCNMQKPKRAQTTWEMLHKSFTGFYRNELIRLVRANYDADILTTLPIEAQTPAEKYFCERPWCYYSDMRFVAPFRIRGEDPVLDRLIELAKPVVIQSKDLIQKAKRRSPEKCSSMSAIYSPNESTTVKPETLVDMECISMDIPAIETHNLSIDETCLHSFFDSLYRSTNALPKSLQRKVKREMLMILNNAEAEAEEMELKA